MWRLWTSHLTMARCGCQPTLSKCQHICEYCVGTHKIILFRGFFIGYGISSNCESLFAEFLDKITLIIFKLLQTGLHFIALDSLGALLKLSSQVMSPTHADQIYQDEARALLKSIKTAYKDGARLSQESQR